MSADDAFHAWTRAYNTARASDDPVVIERHYAATTSIEHRLATAPPSAAAGITCLRIAVRLMTDEHDGDPEPAYAPMLWAALRHLGATPDPLADAYASRAASDMPDHAFDAWTNAYNTARDSDDPAAIERHYAAADSMEEDLATAPPSAAAGITCLRIAVRLMTDELDGHPEPAYAPML